MFKTLNIKLFVIFLAFSAISIIIIFLSTFYNHRKEKIDAAQSEVNHIYISNLLKFQLIENFFAVETRNIKFFKSGDSYLLQRKDSLDKAIDKQFRSIAKNNETKKFNLNLSLARIERSFQLHDSVFNEMLIGIKQRGVADYGYVGLMRKAIHKLDSTDCADHLLILQLRRYEKDYMYRNENRYIDTLKHLANHINNEIVSNTSLSKKKKDSCLAILKNYVAYFDSILIIDKTIGIRDNTGLCLALRQHEKDIQTEFNNLSESADQSEKKLYKNLNLQFVAYSFLLIIISLITSYLLAKRITRPISILANKTQSFVNSGFSNSENFEIKTHDLEIKELIENYILLKDKLVSLLRDFKQRVEERTETINEQNLKLTELNSAKDKFFSIIAHDLKGPFNGILGFSAILHQDIDKLSKEKIREFSRNINESTLHTYKLLENLLDWARLQQGQMIPKLQKISLINITDDICSLNKGSAKNKGIELQNNIATDVFVYCDIDMTTTLLRNLISNSIKFTKRNGRISLSAIPKDKWVEIRIQDTGVGISKEKIQNLFRIDKNETTHGTENEKGTGLGLLLCKELTLKQGGEIRVESEPGIGSVFILTLPIYFDPNNDIVI